MKCPEIRNEIESIEDLRNETHTTPERVASHIEECSNCGRYYKSSQEFERTIFNKIKDIKGAVIPAGLIKQKSRRNSFLRNLFIALPLAGAALIAIVIFFGESDLTEILIKQAIAGTIPFKEADQNRVSQIFSGFHEETGIEPALPEDIDIKNVTEAAFFSSGSLYVCAFKCRYGKEEHTLFIYEGNRSHWSCCNKVPCTCLSTDSCKAERWKKGELGYLIVTASHLSGKKSVFIIPNLLHKESYHG